VIHPSLWFDAVRLIPLLAELPFYTSRHDQDARCWQQRFAAVAGQEAQTGREQQAARRPLPAVRNGDQFAFVMCHTPWWARRGARERILTHS
jgi:hypothetical protein